MDNTELDRVALVTGSARRIGAEVIRKLHAEGMRVIVHYLGSEQAATALIKELNANRADSAAKLAFDLHKTDQYSAFLRVTQSIANKVAHNTIDGHWIGFHLRLARSNAKLQAARGCVLSEHVLDRR